jgi:hypothetical protein
LPNFREIVVKRLLEHNVVPTKEDALKFCDNLYNTGAYIAGSFILDCLYDTNYHNDIDVYDQTETVDNHFNRFNYEDFSKNRKDLKFTHSLYDLNFESSGKISETDILCRSYINVQNPDYNKSIKRFPNRRTKSKNLVQIIPINMKLIHAEISVIPRFIKRSFDLDICKNIFDGNNIHIYDITKLIYRYDVIKPNPKFMTLVYDFRNNENDDINRRPIPIYKSMLDATEEKQTKQRIDKYIERGFNITYHPKYKEIKQHISDCISANTYCVEDCIPGECNNIDHKRDNIKCIENGNIDLSKW